MEPSKFSKIYRTDFRFDSIDALSPALDQTSQDRPIALFVAACILSRSGLFPRLPRTPDSRLPPAAIKTFAHDFQRRVLYGKDDFGSMRQRSENLPSRSDSTPARSPCRASPAWSRGPSCCQISDWGKCRTLRRRLKKNDRDVIKTWRKLGFCQTATCAALSRAWYLFFHSSVHNICTVYLALFVLHSCESRDSVCRRDKCRTQNWR